MSTSRPFSYNPFTAGITGTTQVGNLAVGNPTDGFLSTGLVWWGGPDEDLGYVIAHPQAPNNQPTPDTTKQLYWDFNHRGNDIFIAGQYTYQQFGYQQTVLSSIQINNTKKVMVSYTIGNNQGTYPIFPGGCFVGFGNWSMNYQGNPYGGYPGNDTNSIGISCLGEIYYNGSITDTGLPTWGNTGDIVDMAFDGVNQSWWIRVNGGYWNNDQYADPENNVNGYPTILSSFYLAVCPYINTTFTINNYSKYSVPNSHPEEYPGVNQFYFLGRKTASVGFWRTPNKTLLDFLDLANYVGATYFNNPNDAVTWLNTNGYWTSYVPPAPILSLDAATYSGVGKWIDSVHGRGFELNGNGGGPIWDSNFGGLFQFNSSSQDYAVCTGDPLPALPIFSYEVWHQWDGDNIGSPQILTDLGSNSINYALGQLDISYPFSSGKIQGGFYDQNNGWQTQSIAPYELVFGAWTHIVVTFDENQILRVWVDKNLVSVTQHYTTPTTEGVGIGLMRGTGNNAGFWGGALVLVNIYDKALDQYDVNNQYELNINRFT